jgi:hypothetical protein
MATIGIFEVIGGIVIGLVGFIVAISIGQGVFLLLSLVGLLLIAAGIIGGVSGRIGQKNRILIITFVVLTTLVTVFIAIEFCVVLSSMDIVLHGFYNLCESGNDYCKIGYDKLEETMCPNNTSSSYSSCVYTGTYVLNEFQSAVLSVYGINSM